jgi:4-oxalocrotonate tautomerase
MPIISISTYSGRTQREKDRLAEAITEDVKKIFNVDKKDVIIVFQEEPHGNWYAEGIRLLRIGTSTLMQYILTRYDMHMVSM